jgi:phosphonate transport system ATP-binding protein
MGEALTAAPVAAAQSSGSGSGLGLSLRGLSARHPAARVAAGGGVAGPKVAPALQPLSLQVQPGEQLAVIGPSGAGKTTLMHALACALPAAEGQLLIHGQDPWQLREAARQRLRGRLFLAPQTPPLPPRQRVVTAVLAARLPQMGLWASLASLLRPRDAALAHAALCAFDLGDKLWDRVDRLSGGERQRVGLARALVSGAGLWLVDEPLSALDPTRAAQAITTLTQAAHERGVTLLATLHQVDMALARFPRIVGLRDGRLAFDLPAHQVTRERLQALYAQHEHELTGVGGPADGGIGTGDLVPAPPPSPTVLRC